MKKRYHGIQALAAVLVLSGSVVLPGLVAAADDDYMAEIAKEASATEQLGRAKTELKAAKARLDKNKNKKKKTVAVSGTSKQEFEKRLLNEFPVNHVIYSQLDSKYQEQVVSAYMSKGKSASHNLRMFAAVNKIVKLANTLR
ncbi:MAG: hypothetical protein IME93_01600 [Proteobacteria bacterium]|nr:hypothetical protein [Pseudomonadota bacterium]